MSYRETAHLRVLIANERKDRLDVEEVGVVTARERPDVGLVGLGASSEHALGLIDKIVRAAACPVIVLPHAPDPAFLREASKRGVSLTSQTTASITGKARSTSCSAASLNTTTSKARSDAAR